MTEANMSKDTAHRILFAIEIITTSFQEARLDGGFV
jgi:hypothetical protein